jgi:hypothetical protein
MQYSWIAGLKETLLLAPPPSLFTTLALVVIIMSCIMQICTYTACMHTIPT